MSLGKNYLIFGIVAVIFLLVIGFLVLRGGSSNPQNFNDPLPAYILSADEERQVAEFVKSFVNLYNTYSYDDLTNPPALGDYQTGAMQEKTFGLLSSLESILPEGYAKDTIAEIETFRYEYKQANRLRVTMDARVTETGTGIYSATASLILLKVNDHWYVDNIEINKK